jgi:hypothetical protein
MNIEKPENHGEEDARLRATAPEGGRCRAESPFLGMSFKFAALVTSPLW